MFQFTQIDKNIQDTLHKRINALTRSGEFNPLDPTAEQQSNAVSEMLTKTCWVRVTTSIPDFKRYEGEKDDPDSGKVIRPLEIEKEKPFRLSGNFKDGQPINRPITSKVNLMNNPNTSTLRAPAGVTGVSTAFANHSIQNVTINWKLYDRDDFDVYEQGFLTHGRIVLVEFGWNVPNVNLGVMEKPSDMMEYYQSIQKRIINSGGDYYAAIGKIKSFSYNIGTNGEFDCTTELTSMGSTLFKGLMDTGDPIPDLLKSKNQEKIEEAYAKVNLSYEEFMKDFDNVLKKQVGKEQGVYYNEKREKGYCSWGWFEDNVLNTFFTFTTKAESGKEIRTEMRSLGTGYKNVDGTITKQQGENPCRVGPDLFTKDLNIILPGRIAGFDDLKKAKDIESFDDKVREDYETTAEIYSAMNNPKVFQPFVPSNQTDRGSIRRFVFSSDFLKKSFSKVRDLDAALTTHWSNVSAAYGSYWNFETINDQDNNGRVGVIDSFKPESKVSMVNPSLDKSVLSKPGNTNGKTFVFPLYSTRSLFKDFSLQVNLSSAMATQALYHSQKNFAKEGQNTTNKPEDLAITAMSSLQNQSMTDPEGKGGIDQDFVLKDVTPTIVGADGEGGKMVKRSDPNDPNSELKVVDNNLFVEGEPLSDAVVKQQEIEAKIKNEEEIKKADSGTRLITDNAGLIYKSNGEMMNSFQRGMDFLLLKKDDANVDVDPVTPIEVSFTMPGIGGIQMYDIFGVDYLPDNYRRYGLFQVSGMDHTLSTAGWDTKITGKLRVDMETLTKDAKAQFKYKDSTEEKINYSETSNINFLALIQNSKEEQTEESTENDKDAIAQASYDAIETGDVKEDVE